MKGGGISAFGRCRGGSGPKAGRVYRLAATDEYTISGGGLEATASREGIQVLNPLPFPFSCVQMK